MDSEEALDQARRPKRIVIATIGSLGDLHPSLVLGQELTRRGCCVTIATTPYYKEKVEGCGVRFRPMRPAWDPTDAKMIASCEDIKRGLEVLYRDMLLPALNDTYEDLLAATADADLLITGELVFASPLVAEKRGLPWVSLILSPWSFFSCIDPPLTPNLPAWWVYVQRTGPAINKLALALVKPLFRHWSNPVRELRRKEGLQWKTSDPVFKDKFSPYLVLAMFSQWFAAKQRDWPVQTLQPGFLHRSSLPDAQLADQLDSFFADGDSPLVFTQGSTAVHNPRDFYEVSAQVAKRIGRRALLVGGQVFEEQSGILAVPYVPYSYIFPRAAVNVHQGGSGTTGDALRAGRPMLVVPYGWDQPDNAMRVERLGAGLHLPRSKYTVEAAISAIRRLLDEPRFASVSAEINSRVQDEDAGGAACDAISALLG